MKTIRFYCEEGLIYPNGRGAGVYRLFSAEVFAAPAPIRTLKALDIPLQATICSKVDEIKQNITALRELHVELMGLLRDWQDRGGRKSSAA